MVQENNSCHPPGALIHLPRLPLPNPMCHYVLTLLDVLLIDTAISTACPKPSHFGKLPITANTECASSACMSTVPPNPKWHWTAACLGQSPDSMAFNIQYVRCVQNGTKLNEHRSPLPLNNSELVHYPLCFLCSSSTEIFIWPQLLLNVHRSECCWFSQQRRDFSVGEHLRASYLKMIDGMV